MSLKSELQKVVNKATIKDIGKKVLVMAIGEDPIEAEITKIDEATGLILEVVFKDENKRKKYLDVKDKVIQYLPWALRVFNLIFGWFKTKNK